MGIKLFDQYSLLHFAVGVFVYFWGIDLCMWFILHTIFEYVENTKYGMEFINNWITWWPGGKPHPDSFINSVGDTISAISGWLAAYFLDYVGKKYEWYT